MESWKNFFVFGITPAAAVAAVWYVVKLLKFSEPLKLAVLATITDPKRPTAELLRLQFGILRRASIGSRPLSRRRTIAAGGLLTLWVVLLGLSCWLTPQYFLGFVGANFFEFLGGSPLISVCLMIATALIFLATINVFDFLITLVVFRKVRPIVNAALLVAAYLAILTRPIRERAVFWSD